MRERNPDLPHNNISISLKTVHAMKQSRTPQKKKKKIANRKCPGKAQVLDFVDKSLKSAIFF